jgi:protein-L-isoaspartate(D-aspartate) O-methyltransferase
MGIRDARVLGAVEQVPRELFVPAALQGEAEADRPLPIGHGQTISQPYIVAFMTEALQLAGSERVLEVGTGSGYQTALLSLLARRVFSIEIVPELAAGAAAVLRGVLGLDNIDLRVGDGRLGWPEEAPFDRILVTAAPTSVPAPLLEQLSPGGRMVIPVGPDPGVQRLRLLERTGNGAERTVDLLPVRFVPMTGGQD